MTKKKFKEDDAILKVQLSKLREVAELRWDGIAKLIRGYFPVKRVANLHEQALNNRIEIA